MCLKSWSKADLVISLKFVHIKASECRSKIKAGKILLRLSVIFTAIVHCNHSNHVMCTGPYWCPCGEAAFVFLQKCLLSDPDEPP